MGGWWPGRSASGGGGRYSAGEDFQRLPLTLLCSALCSFLCSQLPNTLLLLLFLTFSQFRLFRAFWNISRLIRKVMCFVAYSVRQESSFRVLQGIRKMSINEFESAEISFNIRTTSSSFSPQNIEGQVWPVSAQNG